MHSEQSRSVGSKSVNSQLKESGGSEWRKIKISEEKKEKKRKRETAAGVPAPHQTWISCCSSPSLPGPPPRRCSSTSAWGLDSGWPSWSQRPPHIHHSSSQGRTGGRPLRRAGCHCRPDERKGGREMNFRVLTLRGWRPWWSFDYLGGVNVDAALDECSDWRHTAEVWDAFVDLVWYGSQKVAEELKENDTESISSLSRANAALWRGGRRVSILYSSKNMINCVNKIHW